MEALVCADAGFNVAPFAAGAFAGITAGFAAGATGFTLAWLEGVSGFAGAAGLMVLAWTAAGFAVVAGEGLLVDVVPDAGLLVAVRGCCAASS